MKDGADPNLRLGGLSLWVHGREFPDSTDYWDGNWLVITALAQAGGARVEASGPLIRSDELQVFTRSLKSLSADLRGKAELACLEPGLHVVMEGDGLGHIAIMVEITPDQMTQSHSFDFNSDQTFLLPLISACEAVLERYPVIASPSR